METLSVMVTGSDGFLGRHLSKHLEKRGFKSFRYNHRQLDITDASAVLAAVDECKPDILVHCAAISSTAYAAEHPEESLAVNVAGCENMAKACKRAGAGLYVMSSDQVYGGCDLNGPLPESVQLAPNNIYGKHKLLMESRVLDIMPEALALRLSWMYENYNTDAPHTDIVSRMVTGARNYVQMKASVREYRGMSDVDMVCENICLSFGRLPGGVYNFGSGNALDTYSTLREVSALVGMPEEMIVPDNSWGRNLSMDCSRLSSYGLAFPDTVKALSGTLQTWKQF